MKHSGKRAVTVQSTIFYNNMEPRAMDWVDTIFQGFYFIFLFIFIFYIHVQELIGIQLVVTRYSVHVYKEYVETYGVIAHITF
jgi:hypothetical protein